MIRGLGFALLLLVSFHTAAFAEPGSAFATLRALVGDWEGQSDSGRAISVTYRLIANDTVLVETWTLSPTRQSMTVYHMDNGALMATHYCPLGNQPRLLYTPDAAHPDRLDFTFRDATNLASLDDAHQHAFWVRLNADGSLDRSETYMANGEAGEETIRYRRVR